MSQGGVGTDVTSGISPGQSPILKCDPEEGSAESPRACCGDRF
jgi:hypothetical protein